jgi:hypothetical protein
MPLQIPLLTLHSLRPSNPPSKSGSHFFFLSSHNVRVGLVVAVMRVFRGSAGPVIPMVRSATAGGTGASPPRGRTSWSSRTAAARRRRTDAGPPPLLHGVPDGVAEFASERHHEGQCVMGANEVPTRAGRPLLPVEKLRSLSEVPQRRVASRPPPSAQRRARKSGKTRGRR